MNYLCHWVIRDLPWYCIWDNVYWLSKTRHKTPKILPQRTRNCNKACQACWSFRIISSNLANSQLGQDWKHHFAEPTCLNWPKSSQVSLDQSAQLKPRNLFGESVGWGFCKNQDFTSDFSLDAGTLSEVFYQFLLFNLIPLILEPSAKMVDFSSTKVVTNHSTPKIPKKKLSFLLPLPSPKQKKTLKTTPQPPPLQI